MRTASTERLGARAAGELAFFEVDEGTLARVLAEAMSHGGEYADLYFEHGVSNTVGMEDGIVHRAASHVDRGVGVRVLVGDQTGYAYSEDLDLASMLRAARTAALIARGGGGVPPQGFGRRERPSLYEIREPWESVAIDRKLAILRRAEALARGLDPSVEKVSLQWGDNDERVLLATSEGIVATDRRPMSRLFLSVTCVRDGQVQSNGSNLAGRHGIEWFDEARLQQVAREAVERTTILFEARRPPAGEMPVVLAAGASGILLHEAIGHGMEADFNRKGVSIYSTMIGKKVADPTVTIVDSAVLPGERGALNVDDEGSATEETVLVEDGVMRSYLHDRISAKHYGVKPTGSGRRESFRFAPMPRMRCTFMRAGPHPKEDIIRAVDRGVLAETFTNGQVQIGAGDFTFYIKNGWMIEGGRLAYPIKDINIIGNGPEALRRITMVGDDLKLDTGGWTSGKDGQGVPVSQGMPTALVSKLVVGGEDAGRR
jgi:TldD protein